MRYSITRTIGWLRTTRELFGPDVESSSDVVLTGHEHKEDLYQKIRDNAGAVHYIEGGVLQERGSPESSFNVVVIDLVAKQFESSTHVWDGGAYISQTGRSHTFVRNLLINKKHFQINEDYFRYLNETEIPIKHPRKQEVTLDDLFVYPAILSRSMLKPVNAPKFVYSDGVADHIRSVEENFDSGRRHHRQDHYGEAPLQRFAV